MVLANSDQQHILCNYTLHITQIYAITLYIEQKFFIRKNQL